MTKLEEARKRRIDAMKSFRTNEDLKEKILDGILQVLDYRTHVNAFDPVEIIFKGDFKPSHITRNYVWIGYSFLSYQYGEHKIGIYFGNCIESLRWYASIIHEYLSEQEELVVSELCQSEEENSTSFTVNFSVK